MSYTKNAYLYFNIGCVFEQISCMSETVRERERETKRTLMINGFVINSYYFGKPYRFVY